MKNDQIKILLVDDEPDILEVIGYNLSQEGYKIHKAFDGKEAIKVAKKTIPHLIIIDIMMPNMDGIETCELLRENKKLENTIIVFLTARNEEYSYIAGFNAGADDYITKPIKPKILSSKVKGLLRRIQNKNNTESILTFGDLVINVNEHKIILDGEEIFLPKKEFELLCLLTSDTTRVFKRQEIIDSVWGSDVLVTTRTIDVHIRLLRKKIGKKYFKTIKGVGYKFTT